MRIFEETHVCPINASNILTKQITSLGWTRWLLGLYCKIR